MAGLYGLKPEYVEQVFREEDVGSFTISAHVAFARNDGKSGSNIEGLCSDRREISGNALYGRGISPGESRRISKISPTAK